MKHCILLLTIFIFLVGVNSRAQNTNILQHHIPYSAYDQNMWGADTAYGINVQHTFFDLHIDESWGFSEVTSIFGQQLGIGFETGIESLLSSSYEAHGFYTGEIDIEYPVDITLDFPDYHSFDYGDTTTIKTSYQVSNGWDLDTDFPPVGVTTLDLEYMIDPYMDLMVCVFGCDTINLIPSSMKVPYTQDTLFHINGQTGYTVYPCLVNGQFQYCHDTTMPIEIPDMLGIGLSASVSLPYVETTDTLDSQTKCLKATGDSLYMNVKVDILEFIHSAASLIPPPTGPNIQQTINMLADTISHPLSTPFGNITAQIAYDLLSAEFETSHYLHQDIEFCPTIWANLSFPTDLPYTITDPSNGGSLYDQGVEDTIRVPVGNDLNIKYPCHGTGSYKDSMYVGVEYDITPTISNHTYDSIAFTISIEALSVSVTIQTPFKKSIKPAKLPSFTLPHAETENCIISASSPAIKSPGVSVPKEKSKNIGPYSVGPLFQWNIPVGNTELTWYDQTWEMDNFIQDTVFPGTHIVPFPKSELNITLYSKQGSFCHGDQNGYLYAQLNDSIAPMTFEWSTGDIHSGVLDEIDSLNVSPGYYSVTATNNYGCTSAEDYTININPPIIHNLTGSDIACRGGSSGIINASISGGTSPYHYNWSYPGADNGIGENNPDNLPAGLHSVTITDYVGCSVSDSIVLEEPDSLLLIQPVTTPSTCYSDSNGAIDLNISGGIPPYIINWQNQAYAGKHLQNLPGGNYNVTITDNNNCEKVKNIIVNNPDSLIATMDKYHISCHGAKDGTISVQTNGGNPPYSYNWFSLNNISDSVNKLGPHLYAVTVVDVNGCKDTAIGLLTEPEALDFELNKENVSCNGLHNGWFDIDPKGGTPFDISHPYHIVYENPNIPDNSVSVTNLSAGFYKLTITDSHNCELKDSIQISEPEHLNIEFINIQNISCKDKEDGSVIAKVTGGTKPYFYNWTNHNIYNDSLANKMDAGKLYNIEVTDDNDCEISDDIILTEPALLAITSIISEPVICGTSPGSASASVIGGTPPYNYIWSNGETNQNADSLPAGNTGITVTDKNNCKDSSSVNINNTGKVNASSQVLSNILCHGDSSAVVISELNNAFSPIATKWFDNNNDLISTKDTLSGVPSGTYRAFVSDLYNCSDSLTIYLDQPDSIDPGIEITRPSCSAVSDGKIITNVSGGKPPYNYKWSTGSANSELINIRDNTYYLTITDYNDCKSVFEIELEEAEYCLIVHNTITPNGDGSNDNWVIENIEEFNYSEVWIYNRNGQKVFYSDNYKNNWSGTYKGNDLPAGTYYYIIDPGTGTEVKKGYLTIIR